MPRNRRTFVGGTGLAILAALTFGLTTPIVERAGRGQGAFVTAALLYAGASLSAFASARLSPSSGPPLRRAHGGRLVASALVGAGIAPTLLAWGLQRTGATTGSLLLNLEAVFTVGLAWAFCHESVSLRVMKAVTLMLLGGVALSLNAVSSPGWTLLRALAMVGATLAWAIDSTLTRGLAEQDPVAVVASKGVLGATMTGALAWGFGEHLPGIRPALVLLACGATGYGLSLRFYILAQRRIGAARTGSVFAVAPFVGAALAWAMGDKLLGTWTLPSAALFAAGVVLHATELHRHPHRHPEVDHDHAHRHDDGHHHHHGPDGNATVGEHSHPHRHELLDHEHDHAPDVHHIHVHS